MGAYVYRDMLGDGAIAERGPYWQPAQARRGFGGYLGAAISIPTTKSDAPPGSYVAVIAAALPNGTIQWQYQPSASVPNAQIIVEGPDGSRSLYEEGQNGLDQVPWLAPGMKLYMLPTDNSGATFAPVASVAIGSTPAIYANNEMNPAYTDELSRRNGGLTVILNSVPVAPPAGGSQAKPPGSTTSPPSTGFFSFLDTLPGGKWPWIIGGALLAFAARPKGASL